MIHILDPHTYRPYFATIALLKAIMETHDRQFEWKAPPYEYEFEKMPIDMILGDSTLRREIEKGADLFPLREKWLKDLESFLEWRRPYLLYS